MTLDGRAGSRATAGFDAGKLIADIGRQEASLTDDERVMRDTIAAAAATYDAFQYDFATPQGRARAQRAATSAVIAARETPEILTLLEESVGAAFFASDVQRTISPVVEQVANQFGITPESVIDRAMSIGFDVDPFVSPEHLLENAKAEAKWYLDLRDSGFSTIGGRANVAEMTGSEIGPIEVEFGGETVTVAADAAVRLDRLVAQPMSAQQFGNRLIVTGEDGGILLDIALDGDVTIGSAMDVVHIVVDALAGSKHEIMREKIDREDPALFRSTGAVLRGGWDGVTWAVDKAGRAWDNVNAPWNWAVAQVQNAIDGSFSPSSDDFKSSTTIQAERRREQAERIAAKSRLSPEAAEQAFVALTAQAMLAENPNLTPMGAATLAAGFSGTPEGQEIKDQINLSQAPSEEAIQAIEESLDDSSGLKSLLNTGLGVVGEVAAVYGKMLDLTAVHLIDSLGDIGEGVLEAFGIAEFGTPSGATGFDAFLAAWDVTDAERLSEYWGIEDPQDALWVDIAANFLIDPLLWFAPSSAARAARWGEALADPARSWRFIDNASTRKIAERLLRANAEGDSTFIRMVTKGMNPEHQLALLNAPLETIRDVQFILTGALPAHGGTWVPNWGGRLATRNTALQNLKWFEAIRDGGIKGKAADLLLDAFGGFDRTRRIGLNRFTGYDDIDDLILNLYADNADEANRLSTELMELQAAHMRAGQAERALAGVAATDSMDDAFRLLREHFVHDITSTIDPDDLARVFGRGGRIEEKVGQLLDNVAIVQRDVRGLQAEIDLLSGKVADGTATADEAARLTAAQDRLTELSTIDARYDDLLREQRRLTAKSNPTDAEVRRMADIAKEKAQIKRSKVPLTRGLLAKADAHSELLSRYERFIEDYKTIQEAAESARAAAFKAPTVNVADDLERFVAQIEHDFATSRLGVEMLDEVDKITGLRRLDWDSWFADFGITRQPFRQPAPSSRLAPFGDAADDMAAGGVLANKSYTYLTLTPQQMVAASILRNDKGRIRQMLANAVMEPQTTLGRFKANIQKLWFLATLANPRVAIRASLDEITRHVYHGGVKVKRSFRHNFQGGEVSSRVTATEDGLRRTVRGQAGALPDRSQAAMNAADLGGLSPSSESWRVATRRDSAIEGAIVGVKQHREAAFRWINGQLIGDDASAAFAESAVRTAEAKGKTVLEVIETVPISEWVTEPFTKFWYEQGRWQAKAPFRGKGSAPMAGWDEAMRAQANGYSALAYMSDAPSDVADWLLRRVANRQVLQRAGKADEAMIRRLGPMPTTQVTKDAKGVGDHIMGFLYGDPGRRRFGFFHADYYDRMLKVFEDADALVGGRTITPQHLVDFGHAPNLDAAELMMLRNNDDVTNIAARHNLWTPRMVEAAADRFARQQALNLMYTPGATSMLGRRIQRVSPFAPAQYDYLQYWGQEMTKAATVGFAGKFEWEIPNFLNMKAMKNRLSGALGNAAASGMELGALPLNLRIAARAGEYAAMFEKIDGSDGLFLPSSLLDELTFFPRLDSVDNFMLDMGPSFGPMPTWVLRMMLEYAPADPEGEWWERAFAAVDETLNTLSPSLGFEEWDGVDDLFRAFLPSYQGSPFDVIENTVDAFRVLTGIGRDSDAFRDSPYMRESLDASLMFAVGDWADDGLLSFIDPDEIYNSAQEFAADKEARDSLFAMLPFGRAFGGEADLTTERWRGFVEELPALVEAGLMGTDIAGNIIDLYGKFEDGNLTQSEREELHDALRNELFSLRDLPDGERIQSIVLTRLPELAVPMTSRYECRLDPNTGLPVDSELCHPDGSPNLPGGPEGRELFNENFGSVFVERPFTDRLIEIQWRVANARRNLLRDEYLRIMGESSFRPGSDKNEAQYEGRTVSLSDATVERLASYGVDAYDGMPAQEFAAAVQRTSNGLAAFGYPVRQDTREGTAWNRLETDEFAVEIMDGLDSLEELMFEQGFGTDVADWPAEAQEAARTDLQSLLYRSGRDGEPLLSPEDYNAIFARRWGPLDWEPKLPGSLDSIEPDFVFDFDPSDIFVIDGDTVDILTPTGPLRFRLIGVNAPDDPMPGAAEAFTDLYDLLKTEGYSDIKLVVWESDLYGTTAGTNFSTGEPRLKAWLFVNGQPIFNADTFTFRNPTGRGSGAVFRPLPRPEES